MKNLHKKKVNVLGKKVSLLLMVGIAALALASAALVPYLSGMVTAETNVVSPFSAHIAEGHVSETEVTLNSIGPLEIIGGDSLNATLKFKYLGERENVEVKELFMINSTEISCEDFDAIRFYSGGPTDGINLLESAPNWCVENEDYLVIGDPSGHNDYDTGEINLVQVEIEFKLNAHGNYKMSAQIVPTE